MQLRKKLSFVPFNPFVCLCICVFFFSMHQSLLRKAFFHLEILQAQRDLIHFLGINSMKANLSVITILIAGFYSDFLENYRKLLLFGLFFAFTANCICFYNSMLVQIPISFLVISQKLFTLTLFILVWHYAPQPQRGRYMGIMFTLWKLATILTDLSSTLFHYSWNNHHIDIIKIASLAVPLLLCSFFFYLVYSQKTKDENAKINKASIPLEIRWKAYLKSFQFSKKGYVYLIILSLFLLTFDIGKILFFKRGSFFKNDSLWTIFSPKDVLLLLLYYPLGYLFDLFHKNNKFLALCSVGGAIAFITHMGLQNGLSFYIPVDVLFSGFLFKMYLLNETSANSYGRTLVLYEGVLYIINLLVEIALIFYEKFDLNVFKYSLLAILAIIICILFIYPRQEKSKQELTQ